MVQTGKSHKPGDGAFRRGAHARELRIIGGKWRGRKLRFPADAPIRPTPDRVRQTLFDWLAPRIEGARCLDLFAGSGALGLEALSRGAARVTFVERDLGAARELRARLTEWQAPEGRVETMDALRYLAQALRRSRGGGLGGDQGDGQGGEKEKREDQGGEQRTFAGDIQQGPGGDGGFDVVFLDPPFESGLLEKALGGLQAGGWLAPGAWVYVEYPAAGEPPVLPEGWTRARTKQAGEVGYDLWATGHSSGI